MTDVAVDSALSELEEAVNSGSEERVFDALRTIKERCLNSQYAHDPKKFLSVKALDRASDYLVGQKTIEHCVGGAVRRYECITVSLGKPANELLLNKISNYCEGNAMFSRCGDSYWLNQQEKKLGIVVRQLN